MCTSTFPCVCAYVCTHRLLLPENAWDCPGKPDEPDTRLCPADDDAASQAGGGARAARRRGGALVEVLAEQGRLHTFGGRWGAPLYASRRGGTL